MSSIQYNTIQLLINMRNILITGGAGYIGSHITEQLIKNKESIIILDNLITGYKKLINKNRTNDTRRIYR